TNRPQAALAILLILESGTVQTKNLPPFILVCMKGQSADQSPLRKHAADVLMRARRLPVGHDRNDLRQLAIGLLWLERNGVRATTKDRAVALLENQGARK